MLERLLQDNVIWPVALALLVVGGDHLLAAYEIALYHARAKDYITFEGVYDLAPSSQNSSVLGRLFNSRFFIEIVGGAIAIFVVWDLATHQYNQPEVFSVVLGGLVLTEAAVAIRRLRNILLFHYASTHAFKGEITYPKRLVHTLAFAELYGFAAIYLFASLLTSSWFLFGGALACFVAGRRYRDWTVVWA